MSHELIVTLGQIIFENRQQEKHVDRQIFDILINWFPMLLLVGVWIYFIARMRGGPLTKYQKDCFDLTERQVVALERIAAELAIRNGSAISNKE